MKQEELIDAERPRAYVYPTWITKQLAGENKCWYQPWYKAHFRYKKLPDNPDRADFFRDYTERHDTIVRHRVMDLKLQGYTVKVEDEGSFRVKGQAGDISGKPDIVAMKDDVAVVIDAKSGKPRQSDHWQVLLYMMLLPLDWLKGFAKVRGEVEYKDGTADVRPIEAREREEIGEALRRVMGPEAPTAVPSAGDCKFCDIERCQFRFQSTEGSAEGLF